MKKAKLLAIGLAVSLGMLSGCEGGNVSDVSPGSNQESDGSEMPSESGEADSQEEDAIESGDIDISDIEEETSSDKNEKGSGEHRTIDLSVYVSCDEATTLRREVRPLEVEGYKVGWAVLNALKESPEGEDCYPAVPENITFNKLVIKDGVATVDFDDGGVGMGSAGESIFIESVVLSLTKFPTVDSVVFTKNGEENPELGNFILDREFDRSDVTYSEVIE